VRVSLRWLREILPVDASPDAIAEALTGRGLPVDAVEPFGDDFVLDVDVPANRPDILGHRGVAREVRAAFGGRFEPQRIPPNRSGRPAAESIVVRIDDPARCSRYVAGVVRGVRVGPSPPWAVARLEACGLRSVNNVVDVSNLVMMELGQPVHFFDLAAIAGPEIRVRGSRPGERLVTLDGVLRELRDDTLVIADASRPVALAGVMGGAETEIHAGTTDVLVEAASFAPSAVRAAARGLGIVTDAAQRFERGSDPDAPPAAEALASALLCDLAAGTPAPAPVDVHPAPRPSRRSSVRLSRASALLGFSVTEDDAMAALGAVDLRPERSDPDTFSVLVPSWRVDLDLEADLVEEIGRHVGYDRVPDRLPPGVASAPVNPPPPFEEEVRDLLAGLGFHEAVSYAMIGAGEDLPFVPAGSPAALGLVNPITEGLAQLRRSLLPGLVRAAARNLRRGVDEVRLFEVGRVFVSRALGEFPAEPLRAAAVWAGAGDPPHWSRASRPADLYDAAGVVESLLAAARREGNFSREPDSRPGFHPGRSVSWRTPAGTVAWCGEIHPDLRLSLDLPATLFLAEIDLSLLDSLPSAPRAVRPVPKVPAVRRDLSVVLERSTQAASLLERLRAVPAPEPVDVRIVDRYAGPPLDPGEAAVTVRVMLQPLERTLSEESIERYRQELVAAVRGAAGARMRE
jgi:phenylalanyl-tRNA synthetase beta chain